MGSTSAGVSDGFSGFAPPPLASRSAFSTSAFSLRRRSASSSICSGVLAPFGFNTAGFGRLLRSVASRLASAPACASAALRSSPCASSMTARTASSSRDPRASSFIAMFRRSTSDAPPRARAFRASIACFWASPLAFLRSTSARAVRSPLRAASSSANRFSRSTLASTRLFSVAVLAVSDAVLTASAAASASALRLRSASAR